MTPGGALWCCLWCLGSCPSLFSLPAQGPGSRILGPGSGIQDLGPRVQDPGSGVQDPGFRRDGSSEATPQGIQESTMLRPLDKNALVDKIAE